MKKQLSFLLPLLALTSVILWGCKKDNAPRLTQTEIDHTYTVQKAPGVLEGTFVAKGDPSTSGSVVMHVTTVGTDSFHCTQAYTQARGTFTIISDCSNLNNTGAWYVASGTDAYANLEGNGSLVMTTSKAGFKEVFYGNTWRR
jgi:hypothetical protein